MQDSKTGTNQSHFRNNKEKEELVTGDRIINQQYQLVQLLGKGSFGEVYRALYTGKQAGKPPKEVAVKVENDLSQISQLSNELVILKLIHEDFKNARVFPKVYQSGVENGKAFMMMDLLGPNIADLMSICGGKFSLQTSVMLALGIIERAETLHDLGYIHRDIKPENFMMGIGRKSRNVFMVDFGLSKKYRDSVSKMMVPYKEGVSMVGTVRYNSIPAHLGVEQSRRDDLESIIYMLIYFIRGELPWQGIRAESKFEKEQKIMSAKMKVSSEDLCQGLPEELYNVLEYVRSLSFYADPDYYFILSQLSYLIEGNDGQMLYDWENISSQTRHSSDCLDIVVDAADFEDRTLEVLGENADQQEKASSIELVKEKSTKPKIII